MNYLWIHEDLDTGFFSEILHILSQLMVAQQAGLIPVRRVILRKNQLFNEPWDDYFINFNPPNISDKLLQKQAIKSNLKQGMKMLPHRLMATEYTRKSELKAIIQKYCKLIPKIEKIFFETKKKLDIFDNKTQILGVHARGTDLNMIRNQQHMQTANAFCPTDIQYIQSLMKNKGYHKIFLATDDIKNLKLFRQTFGKNCVTLDCMRYAFTYDKNGLQICNDNNEQSVKIGKKNLKIPTIKEEFRQLRRQIYNKNSYHIGLEVLLDTFLLAECDALVCGVSGVSNFAIYKSDKIENVWTFQKLRQLKF